MVRGTRVNQTGKPEKPKTAKATESPNHTTMTERYRVVKLYKDNHAHLSLRDFVELYNSTKSMQTMKISKINVASLGRWVNLEPPVKCSKSAKRSTHKSVVINLLGDEDEDEGAKVTAKLRVKNCPRSNWVEIRKVEGRGLCVFAVQDIPSCGESKCKWDVANPVWTYIGQRKLLKDITATDEYCMHYDAKYCVDSVDHMYGSVGNNNYYFLADYSIFFISFK
jgi:hypothetical protein